MKLCDCKIANQFHRLDQPKKKIDGKFFIFRFLPIRQSQNNKKKTTTAQID